MIIGKVSDVSCAVPCFFACRYFSGLIVGCLQGVDKDTLLSPRYCPVKSDYWKEHPMVCELQSVAQHK